MTSPLRCTFLMLLACVGSVLAQPRENPKLKAIDSVGIDVDARCGIANRVDEFLSMPVTLTVSNTTAEPIHAVWEVEFLDWADRQLRSVRKEVELPANMKTSRRTRLYLKRQGGVTVARGGQVVRLRRNREVLWQRIIRSEPISRSAINILAVSPNRERLRFAARKDAPQAALGFNVPGPAEREVKSYAIQSWELPTHSPPLCMFKAVVLSKDADLSLSPAQERALADYLVFGGTIVVAGGKSSAIELLKSNLPPAAAETITKAAGRKTPAPARIGTGLLLFDAEDYFLRTQKSATAATNLAKFLEYEAEPAFPKFLRPSSYVRRGLPVNASKTISMVGVLFVLYALLTGPVIWLILRKQSRKVLAWYIGVTISVFCLTALFVGPILGLRKGDIQWLSVTELTPNGGFQWTMLSLTSAGGKSHQIELQGERLRSWLLPPTVTNDYRFSRFGRFMQNLPLESSMNISMDLVNEDLQQARQDVQISPWGTRLLLTNSYLPAAGQVDVQISHPNLKVRILVSNKSKFTLTDSKIIVSYWIKNQGRENCVIMNTGEFKPGARREFGPGIVKRQMGIWGYRNYIFDLVQYHNWEKSGGCATVHLPGPNLAATPNAYFVAKVSGSPALKIVQSSFEPNLGTHLVVQRIDSRNILNPQLLMNPDAEDR